MSNTASNVSEAKIVHRNSRIAKYLGEAVDKLRQAEHHEMEKEWRDSFS